MIAHRPPPPVRWLSACRRPQELDNHSHLEWAPRCNSEKHCLEAFDHRLGPGRHCRGLRARLGQAARQTVLREHTWEAVARVAGLSPNIDFALLALAERLGLPADAPFRLFAAGRSCGWLAHAMEQAQGGGLIRPRASYAGPPLETGES